MPRHAQLQGKGIERNVLNLELHTQALLQQGSDLALGQPGQKYEASGGIQCHQSGQPAQAPAGQSVSIVQASCHPPSV
jgi:hypothetical protein